MSSNNADLLNTIKRIAIDAVKSDKPAEARYGVVSSVSPLKIRVSATFILPEVAIIVPEHIRYVKGEPDPMTGITPIILADGIGLEVGDKVILMREQGGGKYIVMGRY